MILVYCEHESGQVAVPHGLVEGVHASPRTYDIVNHFVEVDGGGNSTVASHDFDRLCEISIPRYRLATPHEQSEHAKSKRKQGALVEVKQQKSGRIEE